MLPYEIGQHWQRLTKNGLGTDWHEESSTFQSTQWLGVRNEMAFFKVGNEYGNKWKRRESGDKRLPGKTGVNRSKHDRKQFQVWKTKHEPFVRIYDRYLWIPLSNLWQKLVMTNRFKHIRLCFVFRTIATLSSAFFFLHMTVSTYTCAIKFALSRLEEIGVSVPNLTLKNTLFLPE